MTPHIEDGLLFPIYSYSKVWDVSSVWKECAERAALIDKRKEWDDRSFSPNARFLGNVAEEVFGWHHHLTPNRKVYSTFKGDGGTDFLHTINVKSNRYPDNPYLYINMGERNTAPVYALVVICQTTLTAQYVGWLKYTELRLETKDFGHGLRYARHAQYLRRSAIPLVPWWDY